MAVTETTTESWGSRLGSSIKGVLIGLVLFIAGFPVLFWNEGNAVRTRKALEEGQGACVPVASIDKVDPAQEGKLVHMTGKADTKDVLKDDAFGVTRNAIKLKRKVEMYQWVETKTTTETKNAGGSVTKTTTYDYKKDWREKPVDSSSFKEAGHDNPATMEWSTEKWTAANVSFGAFRLSGGQIASIGAAQTLALPTNFVCPVARVQVKGNTIWVPNAATRNNPKNVRDVAAQPRVGDLRVTFTEVLPHVVSLVAKQQGDTFGAFVASNGKKVQLLTDGEKSSEEMFADAQSANTMMCWIIRLVGVGLMFIGLTMFFKPLSVLADVLPILGDLVGMGTGFVAGVLSLVCGLSTIAVAWLFYRPVLGVALFAAVAALVVLLLKRRAARKAAA